MPLSFTSSMIYSHHLPCLCNTQVAMCLSFHYNKFVPQPKLLIMENSLQIIWQKLAQLVTLIGSLQELMPLKLDQIVTWSIYHSYRCHYSFSQCLWVRTEDKSYNTYTHSLLNLEPWTSFFIYIVNKLKFLQTLIYLMYQKLQKLFYN